jgi:hypothetical protein
MIDDVARTAVSDLAVEDLLDRPAIKIGLGREAIDRDEPSFTHLRSQPSGAMPAEGSVGAAGGDGYGIR